MLKLFGPEWLPDFNEHTHYKLELSEAHKTNLENIFNKNLTKYKSALWHKLSNEYVGEQKEFLNDISYYQKNEEWIKDKIKSYKYQFLTDLDYEGLWGDFIIEEHGELNFDKAGEFDAYLENNKKQVQVEEPDSLSSSHRSLLYFEGGANEVNKEIEYEANCVEEAKKQNNIDQGENQEPETSTQDIPVDNCRTTAFYPENNPKKRRGSYKYNSHTEQRKKDRGGQECVRGG